MPTVFLPPTPNPGGVAPVTVGGMPGQPIPPMSNPGSGIASGLTQALMLAKLRQGKLGVPTIPGQAPQVTTQPGVQLGGTSTPGLPDQ